MMCTRFNEPLVNALHLLLLEEGDLFEVRSKEGVVWENSFTSNLCYFYRNLHCRDVISEMEYDAYWHPHSKKRMRTDIVSHWGKERNKSNIHSVIECKFMDSYVNEIWDDYNRIQCYRAIRGIADCHLNLVIYPDRSKALMLGQGVACIIPPNLSLRAFKGFWKIIKKNNAPKYAVIEVAKCPACKMFYSNLSPQMKTSSFSWSEFRCI